MHLRLIRMDLNMHLDKESLSLSIFHCYIYLFFSLSRHPSHLSSLSLYIIQNFTSTGGASDPALEGCIVKNSNDKVKWIYSTKIKGFLQVIVVVLVNV